MAHPSRGACLLVAALCFLVSVVPLGAQTAEPASADALPLARHAAEAQALLTALQAVLGPLPAIASTPFFGLAGLTGLALIARSDSPSVATLSALLRKNALVTEAGHYASPGLLLALIALAVVGWLANSGKIQGVVGKAIRLAEDSSAVMAYLFLALATLAPRLAEGSAPLHTAGALDATAATLIAVAIAMGLAAMMVLRFALDLLIWLSPVPFIDLAFETAKWLFSAGFAALALFFPRTAAVLSLLLALVAIVCSRWALRLLRFALTLVLAPAAGRLLGSVADPPSTPLDLPAVALRAPGLPAREPGRIEVGPGGPVFAWRSWLGKPRSLALSGDGRRLELGRALLWLELRVLGRDGKVEHRYALSSALAAHEIRLRAALGASDGGTYGLASLGRSPASPVSTEAPGAHA